MTLRLASVGLVLGAALADASGHHGLAYYLLVTAVPVVAIAALSGVGDVLDGSASEPYDRGIALLSALALPLVLLGTAVRAPLLSEGPPPAIGVTAIVAALAIFAVQALVTATIAPRGRVRSGLEPGSEATL